MRLFYEAHKKFFIKKNIIRQAFFSGPVIRRKERQHV